MDEDILGIKEYILLALVAMIIIVQIAAFFWIAMNIMVGNH